MSLVASKRCNRDFRPGARRPSRTATAARPSSWGAPVSTGGEAQVTEVGNHRFFAGWRSDPFFFDVEGALNNLQFTGDDYFADKDVCSIVLELPNSDLGSKAVGLWARTLVPADGAGEGWVQADRGALPAQTCFLPGEENAAYLSGEPADDARFVAVFAHSLEHAGGYSPEEARRVAGKLLPDLLRYDPTRPSFPDNGRALTDNVQDAFLAILTNGKVTEESRAPRQSARRVPVSGAAAQRLKIQRREVRPHFA